MTDNHYDVIIIGTGAGGGTLAYHLAPSGKRILILERGDYVPREKANWDSQVVNVDAHYNTKESWLTRMARTCTRTPTTTWAATRSFTVPRCSVCAKRISANYATTAASRPRGRSATTIWSRTTHKPKICIRSTASAEKIPPNRRPARPIPGPPSATNRVSNSCPMTSRVRVSSLSTSRRRDADEKNPHKSRCIRCNTCDGYPCLVGAKSDAQVVCVDEAVKHSERYPAHQLAGEASGNRFIGSRSEKRGCGTRRPPGELFRRCGRRLLRRDQFCRPALALHQRQTPARSGQQLGCRRPALHGTHQFRNDGDLKVP